MMKTNNGSQSGVQARDCGSVEIKQEHENLTLSIKEKMEKISFSHCICRAEEKFFKDNKENYFPKVISIGPFHHGLDSLKAMEDKKWRYLNTLLSRKPNVKGVKAKELEPKSLDRSVNSLLELEQKSLDRCVNSLLELEPKVRRFYGETIELLSNDELVKIMLVDGCFIIELLLKYSMKSLRRRDDPFFNRKEMFFQLRCDLILLENQVPFFVLQHLFSIVPIPKQCTQSLTELAFLFLRKLIPGDIQIFPGKFNQDFNHLLDLIHNCYLPTFPESESPGLQRELNTATKLQKLGIGFKKANRESLLDIKFVLGRIEIPPLMVHDYTEIVLRNLIALESCYCDGAKHVSSYVYLMGRLIQTQNDVKLLHSRQILPNVTKSREDEIVNLFKKIHVEPDAKDNYYKALCEQASRYKRPNWGTLCCWRMKQII